MLHRMAKRGALVGDALERAEQNHPSADIAATIAALEAVERLAADLQALVRRQLEALDAATPPAEAVPVQGRASLRESPLGELFRATADRTERAQPARTKKSGQKTKKTKKTKKKNKKRGKHKG
jgi:hypothetical protein